jgi:hypothetical protein
MNSLPFISHHLFVAAIGNEARSQERAKKRDRSFTAPAGQGTLAPLEVLCAREPILEAAARTSRARLAEARG